MFNPLYKSIVTDSTTQETLYVTAVLALQGQHYVVYAPLATNYPIDGILDSEFEADYHDCVEFVGVGRVYYDYEELTATIEPLHEDLDCELIDAVLGCLGYQAE